MKLKVLQKVKDSRPFVSNQPQSKRSYFNDNNQNNKTKKRHLLCNHHKNPWTKENIKVQLNLIRGDIMSDGMTPQKDILLESIQKLVQFTEAQEREIKNDRDQDYYQAIIVSNLITQFLEDIKTSLEAAERSERDKIDFDLLTIFNDLVKEFEFFKNKQEEQEVVFSKEQARYQV